MKQEVEQNKQSEKEPSTEILQAFGLSGTPTHLPGGQGECYCVDGYVLKPYKGLDGAEWIHGAYDTFQSDKIRVPKPLRASNGSWLHNGWGAISMLEGKSDANVSMTKMVEINKLFHQEASNIPKPDILDKRNDVWSVADRVCWGEEVVADYNLTNDIIKKVLSLLKPNTEPSQLIHGDFGPGNVLIHDTLPPAIIDLSPYWRPASFSIAVMLVDEVAYKGADLSIFDLGKDVPNFNQHLLRGATRRLCEYIGHELHPENETDRRPDMKIHMDIIEHILKKYFNQ